jgi:GT2 family glycosyltransferase
MLLSIVIVNYNVRHFLEQCLLSVEKALKGISAEVFVVDNNSVDGSQVMVQEKFSWVKAINNRENVGFAAANNQAIRQAQGKYVLLLNPDTVVEEDTFAKILDFMELHPEAGALGVQMVNGKGEFLPESKRALPTPWVAFYKIFGLAALFPNSRTFGKYHLSYLDSHQNHEVEVLSGACMLLRKKALDKVGLLDEDFFMYGEDVDLSYRIIKGGYKNYYVAETKIIHYKGESTKKGSLNYVLVFYQAMLIFARKHFSANRVSLFMWLIQFAIYFRAALAIGRRLWNQCALPLAEFVLLLATTLGIKYFWEAYYQQSPEHDYYPPIFNWAVAPVYALIFILFLFLFGAYRRPFQIRAVILAVFSSFITIATGSFVFKHFNFSRAIVALLSLAAVPILLTTRALVNYFQCGSFVLTRRFHRRVLLIGQAAEAARVAQLLEHARYYHGEVIGRVFDGGLPPKSTQEIPWIGNIYQLEEIVRLYRVDEIIFCNQDLPTFQIIDIMSQFTGRNLHFKIAPPATDYLVGPNSIIAAGSEMQAVLANLEKPEMRIKKRLLEMAVSLSLLLFFPLTFWLYLSPLGALRNLWAVITGSTQLVGYINPLDTSLPTLKSGILHPGLLVYRPSQAAGITPEKSGRLDAHYAQHYSLSLDLEIVFNGLRWLGGLQSRSNV